MAVLGGEGFTGLLVDGAAIVAAVAGGWLLLVLVAGAVEAASRGRIAALRLTGCPAPWRRRLLRVLVPVLAPLLGVGTLTAASTATAAPPGPNRPGHGRAMPAPALLDGLPLPDRQPDAGAAAPARPTATARIEVRPGDTLWHLAAALLPADADARAVASLCARLYELNRAVIGDDPDLIRPGQRLRVPHDSATAQPQEEDR